MAGPLYSKHAMPMLIIDTCSSEDNEDLLKMTLTVVSTLTDKPHYHRFPRSFSLPTSGETYKDLAGALHFSPWHYWKHLWTRSSSCPNTSLPYEKSFRAQSSSGLMNLLDPSSGIHSPGDSSSRHSLYGSFFDLSESGFPASAVPPDRRFLTVDVQPTNTFEDKCHDWLNHLETR